MNKTGLRRQRLSRAAGTWTTQLTATAIDEIEWVVQNGAAGGWSFAHSPVRVTVPANNVVTINANFTASGQFVLVYDTADTNFKNYSDIVTII